MLRNTKHEMRRVANGNDKVDQRLCVEGVFAAHSSEKQSWVNRVNAFQPWHLKDPSKIAH